jgi:hypothetical protein
MVIKSPNVVDPTGSSLVRGIDGLLSHRAAAESTSSGAAISVPISQGAATGLRGATSSDAIPPSPCSSRNQFLLVDPVNGGRGFNVQGTPN